MDLGYSEDCLEVMIKTEEEIALSEGVEKLFSILSEKQRRRLYLYVIKGMKQEEIARIIANTSLLLTSLKRLFSKKSISMSTRAS